MNDIQFFCIDSGNQSKYKTQKNLCTLLFLITLFCCANPLKAQWTVVNSSDCNFTFTINCGGIIQSSNNYVDKWNGSWVASKTKTFSVPCCANPTITITFDPIYGIPPVTGLASTLANQIFGCYPFPPLSFC